VLQALQGSKGYYAALIISGLLLLTAVAAGLHAKVYRDYECIRRFTGSSLGNTDIHLRLFRGDFDRSVPCVSHRSCIRGQGFHAHCQKGHISVDYDDHGGILRHRL